MEDASDVDLRERERERERCVDSEVGECAVWLKECRLGGGMLL